MCGILGIVNFGNVFFSKKKIFEMWKRIEHRGKDLFKIWVDGEEITAKTIEKCVEKIPEKFRVLIAQNTLSITGIPSLPREEKNIVIACNGEVFNYSKLEKEAKQRFLADTDAFFWIEPRKLEKINGIYACCRFEREKERLFLFRDRIGVNPLCFCKTKDFFVFASETKALKALGYDKAEHLPPEKILYISTKTGKVTYLKHPVELNLFPEKFCEDLETLEKLLVNAVERQTAGLKKFGIMLSGGVDSTLIAKIAQEKERKFTCFTFGIEGSEDVEYARKVADEFGFELKETVLDESADEELENAVQKVVYAIESGDFVQVSIALPFYFSSLASVKQRNKVIFSGLGSEELFAGYYKYRKHASKLHENCARGLSELWRKDLYRDDCTVMLNTQELRVPMLDINFVNLAMKIKPELKFFNGIEKYALKKIAEKHIGNFAWRKKRASQYGSRVAKALEKLAKKRGYKKKSEYVEEVYENVFKLCKG